MGEEVGNARDFYDGSSVGNVDGKIEGFWMGKTLGPVFLYERGYRNDISYGIGDGKLE